VEKEMIKGMTTTHISVSAARPLATIDNTIARGFATEAPIWY
jgi:hypothetical protein